MVMSVNTNISSLNAQNNLAKSQSKLSTAIERLSSGMKINSAKDDAAGLAISTRFTTQINGLNQAVSNANDGISLAQTTESALNEVTNNMQRIRTLAVQSANATNSDSDRQALDAEVQQRLAEITRIAQQTTFNGRHVLDGSFGSAAFQIGANVGETISVNLSQGAGAKQVGQIAQSSTGNISGLFSTATVATAASVESSATVGSFDFTGTTGTGSSVTSGSFASFDFSGVGNDISFDVGSSTVTLDQNYNDVSGLKDAVQTQLGSNYVVTDDGTDKLTITTAAHTTDTTDVTISNATSGSAFDGATASAGTADTGNIKNFSIDSNSISLNADYNDMNGLIDAIKTQLGANAVNYALSDDGGKLKIETVATGASAAVAITGANADFFAAATAGADATAGTQTDLTLAQGALTLKSGDGTAVDMQGTYKDAQSLVDAINSKGITGVSAYYDSETKSIHLNSQDDLTVDGTKAGTGAGNLGFSGAGTTPIDAGSNLAASDVKTVAGANDTISRIDSALSTISSMRSDLGAVQNRFSSTIANLQTISQNLSASRSQIQDADFAAETANMSSANILQQAGVSVLAQANSTTQSVLKLLQ